MRRLFWPIADKSDHFQDLSQAPLPPQRCVHLSSLGFQLPRSLPHSAPLKPKSERAGPTSWWWPAAAGARYRWINRRRSTAEGNHTNTNTNTKTIQHKIERMVHHVARCLPTVQWNIFIKSALFGAQWFSCSVCPPKRQKYLWRVVAEYLWWCWNGRPPRQTGKCHQTGCPHRHTRPGHVSQYYILILRSLYLYFLLLLSILQVLCFLFPI